jgi:uncharacterized protein (TIGR03435 family)
LAPVVKLLNAALVGTLATALVLTCTPSDTCAWSQSQIHDQPQASAVLRFDVASVRERKPGAASPPIVGVTISPGRVRESCGDFSTLLFFAYHLTYSSPVDGFPSWGHSPCGGGSYANTYAVEATMPPDTTEAQACQMMQTLLADRFKLAVHWQTKNMPIYALVVARGGFKLRPDDPSDKTPTPPDANRCPVDDLACQRILGLDGPVSDLAGMLGNSAGRPVVDQTGLTAKYKINLEWASETAGDSSLPALSTALQEQLGLELKSATGPVDVLVVDHVEKPTPN